jgi:hypothetical protein
MTTPPECSSLPAFARVASFQACLYAGRAVAIAVNNLLLLPRQKDARGMKRPDAAGPDPAARRPLTSVRPLPCCSTSNDRTSAARSPPAQNALSMP